MPKIYVHEIPTHYVLDWGEWVCQHPDSIIETGEVDTMRNGEHDTYEVTYYACADCGEELDGEPAADRAEALAEMQLNELRGK